MFEAYNSGEPTSIFQAAMCAFEAMFASDEFAADTDGCAAESGTSDKHSLFGMAREARQRIYCTFVGIGVEEEEGLFDNTGIRKGVLLFQYAELIMA